MAKKITCPQCKQKFKTETGLDWHLDHIHNTPKHSSNLNSQKTARPMATGRVTAQSADQAGLQWDSFELKNLVNRMDEVEEGLNCRLDIGLKRACWLSERISALEQNCPNFHNIEQR